MRDANHAGVQGAEFRSLAVGRVGRNREIGVVEWEVKNVSQVKFGVVTQPGADISRRLFALGDPEFATVETIRLLAGPVGHAHKGHACFVDLSRNNEPGAWFGLGMDVIREVAPNDFAGRGFWPPAHQVLSNSNSALRTVPPLALGADFFT